MLLVELIILVQLLKLLNIMMVISGIMHQICLMVYLNINHIYSIKKLHLPSKDPSS